MTKGQIILAVCSVALVGVLYFFGQSQQKKTTVTSDETETAASTSFNIDTYRAARLDKAPSEVKENILSLEEQIAAEKNVEQIKTIQAQLNNLYIDNRMPMLVAEMLFKLAVRDNSIQAWNQAGDAYMAVSMVEETEAAVMYAFDKSAIAYGKSVELDPENIDNKIKLATALMEGGTQTMQGVQLLLGILEQYPDHIPSNLILGRYGIISGQYDKAVLRLEKVISLDPENSEAYFYLAEAYNSLGRKEEAIQTFEKCKKLINDPGFSAEIDNYIQKIKNS